MQKIYILSMCLIIALVLSSCTSENPADSREVTLTEEAQLAALWLSDETYVPRDLALKIQNKLESLREQYSEQIPQVNIEFSYPAYPKAINLTMEEDAYEQVKAGTYHEWDSLNQFYGVDTTCAWDDDFRWVHVVFSEYINPYIIAPEYAQLPGVKYSSEGSYSGDWPNTYPWIVDGEIAFLVREAWGDCPAGCILNNFWYFRSNGDQIDLIGNFEMDKEWWENPTFPAWWAGMKSAICKYKYRTAEDCHIWGS